MVIKYGKHSCKTCKQTWDCWAIVQKIIVDVFKFDPVYWNLGNYKRLENVQIGAKLRT